jgi:hypothetical protein
MKPSRLIAFGGTVIIAVAVMALLLTALRSPIVQAAPVAVCNWSGGDGNWSDTSKWSCGSAPGVSDTAVITNGTVTLNAPVSVHTLILNSTLTCCAVITEGVVTGGQPLTILNSFQWYGGKMLGGGVTTIELGATAVISRQNVFAETSLHRAIWNKGTVNLTGGDAQSAPSSTYFTNTGTFNAQRGNFVPLTFRNEGTLIKSTPGVASLGLSALRNYGTVLIDDGELFVRDGQQFAGVTTLAGGTFSLNGNYLVRDGVFNGNGSVLGYSGSSSLQLIDKGVLAPGTSAGNIYLDAQLQVLSGGSVDIELGGPDLKRSDALIVNRQAFFDSPITLTVSLINGYSPALIDGFSIIRYGSRVGEFTSVINPIAATHPLSYTSEAVTLGNPTGRRFQAGDLFVSMAGGKIKQFDADGSLVAVLDPKLTGNPLGGGGMCFDGYSNLYATQFAAGTLSKFDVTGKLISTTFGTGYGAEPESCVTDSANNLYVGQANALLGSPARIQKRNGVTAALMDVYTATQTDRGTDWIELKADARTLLYTSEGAEILAYDIVSKTQQPNLINGLPRPCFALRVRQNGQVMVACRSAAYLLSSSGAISRTYTVTDVGETDPSGLFALNLDSDGTSFWTAGYGSGKVYKVDINSGNVITSFQSDPFPYFGFGTSRAVVGLAVYGEIQANQPRVTLIETVGAAPASCAGTREITVESGSAVTYCYRIVNTGSVTFTTHALTDTVFGNIFSNLNATLPPGATTFVTRSYTATATTINVATWNSQNGGGQSATASDFTRVNVGLVLDKKVYLPLVLK